MRYSTARCGLLKLALIALCTCSLGNPIATISLILVSSADPEMNDVASSAGWFAAGAGVSASVAAGAEEGAAGPGAFGAEAGAEAGWAGVWGGAGAAAGVEGAAEVAAAEAGAALGFATITTQNWMRTQVSLSLSTV